MSAPIFAANGRIVATVSVLGPTERLTDEMTRKFRPVLVEAAREISDSLAANARPSRSG